MQHIQTKWYFPLVILLLLSAVAYCALNLQRLLSLFLPHYTLAVHIVSVPLAVLLLYLSVTGRNAVSFLTLYTLMFALAGDTLFLFIRLGMHLAGKPWGGWYKILCPVAVLCAVLTIAYGYWNINRIRVTPLTAEAEKVTEPKRIIFLSDTHFGTTQKKAVFLSTLHEISESQPDLLLLGGDIVDEGTSEADMREVITALGNVRTKYGTYFVWGNHDRANYARHKKYTVEALTSAMQEAGITVLCDSYAQIGEDMLVYGREDYSRKTTADTEKVRKDIAEAGKGRFVLMLDHQPYRFKENVSAGTDYQFSGHTHAIQIFPLGRILGLFVYNYGIYTEGQATMFVSCGAAGWGYPIRTERHCEYIELTVKPRQN